MTYAKKRCPLAARQLIDFCALPRIVRVTAWSLAGAYGHEWAGCSLVAVEAGGDVLEDEWRRVDALDEDGARIGGISPSATHRTFSGRTAWAINARTVRVDISRPTGVVLSLDVPHNALRRVRVLELDAERVFVRHIQALSTVLSVLHSEGYADAVTDALIEGGVGRPAYHSDAYDLANGVYR